MNQILLRAEVTLSSLHRSVPQQQMDLFKLAATGAA
jgi:hypothetical protein